jgi:hypothetical protein
MTDSIEAVRDREALETMVAEADTGGASRLVSKRNTFSPSRLVGRYSSFGTLLSFLTSSISA